MNRIRLIALVPMVFAASACANDPPSGLQTPAFGDAVRANIAAQTVNPMAPTDRGPLIADGQRAALQQGRYETDTVEAPERLSTQGVVGGGAGGRGGAGGAGAGVGETVQ